MRPVIAERGIITACDANYFPGLLMLHRSVQESAPCVVACYDLGLTPAQKAQVAGAENLCLLPLPPDGRIDRIRMAMENVTPLAKRHKRVWPLWICPLLISHAPFREVFWMDCDLVVLRNLHGLFGRLASGPVFTPENKAPHLTPNAPALYRLLPIDRPFDPLVPAVNAGVSGWRLERDAAAIEAYTLPVERAIDDLAVRAAISWHDQGALIWAIQQLGLEHRVEPASIWNLCVDNTALQAAPPPWDDAFLANARRAVPQANIVHWNGSPPPWIDASITSSASASVA